MVRRCDVRRGRPAPPKQRRSDVQSAMVSAARRMRCNRPSREPTFRHGCTRDFVALLLRWTRACPGSPSSSCSRCARSCPSPHRGSGPTPRSSSRHARRADEHRGDVGVAARAASRGRACGGVWRRNCRPRSTRSASFAACCRSAATASASATTRTAGSASRCMSPSNRRQFTHGICPTCLEAAKAEFARADSPLSEPPRVR
jgi:hypothetical protein